MTEETRKILEKGAADTCDMWEHVTFNPDCDDCQLGLSRMIAAYELGEKAGRSEKKDGKQSGETDGGGTPTPLASPYDIAARLYARELEPFQGGEEIKKYADALRESRQ